MKHLFLNLLLLCVFASTALALNPSRTYKQLPDKYNMKYEAVEVPTNDGEASLNSWYFPAKEGGKQLILIAHNGEGNMADYLRRVDQFTSAGYNVVTFDYRGYGQSSEFEIDNNMYIYPHFTDDLESMVDHVRKTHTPSFHLYGWGIGAGLAFGVGYNRIEVRKIIADTPFLSMEDLEERFSSWDEPMEVPFAGYDKKHEPIHAVENAPVSDRAGKQILLIVGSNDLLFSKEDMEKLQAKASRVIRGVFVVENPDRKDNFKVDTKKYMDNLVGFISKG